MRLARDVQIDDSSLSWLCPSISPQLLQRLKVGNQVSKPIGREIKACRPWLEAEIAVIKPQIVVALGATAAQSLMGNSFRITQHRGEFLTDTQWAPHLIATLHPSAVLRMPDEELRHQARADFFKDMKLIAQKLSRTHAHA